MKKIIFTLFVITNTIFASSYSNLKEIAYKSLSDNIVEIENKYYLRAGANHFGSLWTRDFAYSAEGLISAKRSDVVRDHLEKLFSKVRKDGLVPRVLDNMNSAARVFRMLTGILKHTVKDLDKNIKPEYKGEHKTIAMDSNVLVLRAALLYLEATGDQEWFNNHIEVMTKIYRFYDQNKNDQGYIVQDDYGDWQDSVKRDGVTFLTNFHYWWVSNKLSRYDAFNINNNDVSRFRDQLFQDFLHPEFGVFSTHENHKELISIDGNLFALLSPDFFESKEQQQTLYQNLKKHPIWKKRKIPGSATFPNYPNSEVSRNAQLALISTYHGKTMWSWLMGLSAKTAFVMEDEQEAHRILTFIEKLATRDNVIAEIYNYNNKIDIKDTQTYRSERPFAWGSAFIYDAASVITK